MSVLFKQQTLFAKILEIVLLQQQRNQSVTLNPINKTCQPQCYSRRVRHFLTSCSTYLRLCKTSRPLQIRSPTQCTKTASHETRRGASRIEVTRPARRVTGRGSGVGGRLHRHATFIKSTCLNYVGTRERATRKNKLGVGLLIGF